MGYRMSFVVVGGLHWGFWMVWVGEFGVLGWQFVWGS